MPATESQARALAGLAPEKQKIAWTRAVETATEGKVTERTRDPRREAVQARRAGGSMRRSGAGTEDHPSRRLKTLLEAFSH